MGKKVDTAIRQFEQIRDELDKKRKDLSSATEIGVKSGACVALTYAINYLKGVDELVSDTTEDAATKIRLAGSLDAAMEMLVKAMKD